MKEARNLKEAMKDVENSPVFKKLPSQVKKSLEDCFKTANKIPFPVVTFKENDWIIATTPVIDLSAQGKTEDEAVKFLIAMIDDYMSDKYTKKPKLETIINMQISVKSIPIKVDLNKIATQESLENPLRAVSNGR